MHFSTSITKIASTPPWANVVNYQGVDGFWVDSNAGMPFFLRKQDHIIWLPKSLRGKKIEDLTPEEIKALPKEDNGKNLYKQWREQHENEQAVGKLHNGYQFSDAGLVLVDRLKKLVDKYELDDLSNLGLDRRYSINPALFDKLLTTNNRDDVKRIGRLIAKKFATAIQLLNQVNPKIAKRLDADFMFQYKKLQALFDFDVVGYNPNVQEPAEPETESGIEPTTLDHVRDVLIKTFVSDAQPLLTDPQLAAANQAFALMQASPQKAEDYLHQGLDFLMKVHKLAQPGHPLAEAAKKVLELPSLKELVETLFDYN